MLVLPYAINSRELCRSAWAEKKGSVTTRDLLHGWYIHAAGNSSWIYSIFCEYHYSFTFGYCPNWGFDWNSWLPLHFVLTKCVGTISQGERIMVFTEYRIYLAAFSSSMDISICVVNNDNDDFYYCNCRNLAAMVITSKKKCIFIRMKIDSGTSHKLQERMWSDDSFKYKPKMLWIETICSSINFPPNHDLYKIHSKQLVQ